MSLELTKLDLPFDNFLDFEIELPFDSFFIGFDSRRTYEHSRSVFSHQSESYAISTSSPRCLIV